MTKNIFKKIGRERATPADALFECEILNTKIESNEYAIYNNLDFINAVCGVLGSEFPQIACKLGYFKENRMNMSV